MEQQTRDFLQKSMLPAMLGLLEVNEHMATQQKEDHAAVNAIMKNTYDRTTDVGKAIELLLEGFKSLKEPLVDLLTAMNESNNLQATQNRLLEEMKEVTQQNTARLELLTIALGTRTEDPGIAAMYDALKQEGGV